MSEMLETESTNMIPDTLSSRTLISSTSGNIINSAAKRRNFLFSTFLHGSTYQYNEEVFSA